MNNNLIIKFDLQTEITDCAYSLIGLSWGKLKDFQHACKDLKYLEILLLKVEESDSDHKTALF